jgi:hypothetical protein
METKKSSGIIVTDEPLRDFEYVDFNVEKEDWNKYRLEDKTILKSKFVLISVIAEKGFKEKMKKVGTDKGGVLKYEFQSTNVVGVEPPEKLMGEPAPQAYTPQELESCIVQDDMDFETVLGTWNVYKLDEVASLKVRTSLMRVRRTSKFDNHGRPIYLVDFTADIKIIPHALV